MNRLVDVVNKDRGVIHTFPVTLATAEAPAADTSYEAKALSAAAHAQLVPDGELGGLTAQMHVSRSGPLQPYGDDRDVGLETKVGLNQVVREAAYFLWLEEGCPEGRALDNWNQAHEQHLRQRAYVMWEQEGRPEGQADDHWHRTRDFEAN